MSRQEHTGTSQLLQTVANTVALAAGAALVGKVGIDQTTPGTTNKVVAELSGSNMEQTLNAALPAKAILVGISDGANIQGMRGNTKGTLLASAVRSASLFTPVVTNYNASKLILVLNITANPAGAETLQLYLYGADPVSGDDVLITTFPVTAAATNYRACYILGLGAAESMAVANMEVQSLFVPPSFRLLVEHSAAGNWTYSLGYMLVL